MLSLEVSCPFTGKTSVHVPAEASPSSVLVCLHSDVRMSHTSLVGLLDPVSALWLYRALRVCIFVVVFAYSLWVDQ